MSLNAKYSVYLKLITRYNKELLLLLIHIKFYIKNKSNIFRQLYVAKMLLTDLYTLLIILDPMTFFDPS